MFGSITLNNISIPYPTSISYAYDKVQNIFETEAGTEQASVLRTDKLTLSCTFQLTSTKKELLRGLADNPSLTLSLDDEATTRTVRIDNFKADLVENSRLTPGTDGLWTVSCDIVEF